MPTLWRALGMFTDWFIGHSVAFYHPRFDSNFSVAISSIYVMGCEWGLGPWYLLAVIPYRKNGNCVFDPYLMNIGREHEKDIK